MKSSHHLADRFVMRTPVLPFATLTNLAAPELTATREALRRLLDDPAIREAVFVASPDVAAQIDEWHRSGSEDPALETTLMRYVSRMAARATPFGLFSGVAVGRLAATTHLELALRAVHQRHTRLDNDYLFKLCDAAVQDPMLRAELTFVRNSSLYRTGERWRYAEGRVTASGRSYHLVAVEASRYLDALLERASAGATLAQLADVLVTDPELTREEIDVFISELAVAQLVVPTLQPRVTGLEPSQVMIGMFAALPSGKPIADALAHVVRELEHIDEARSAPPAVYRAIASTLATLPVEVNLARLFQVDCHLAMTGATLGAKVASELVRGFELVRKLVPSPPVTDTWSKFRTAFAARYETREVPLVEVLDEESGIGFGDAPADSAQAPLVADLAFPDRTGFGPSVTWTKRYVRLLALVTEASASGAIEIELTDADLDALGNGDAVVPLADTVLFSARVIAPSADAIDRGEFQLLIDGFSSVSATRLMGRFCHGSPELTAHVNELTRIEAACAPDAILAEIVHLPEGRIGNVLLRPVLRDYEIPYLGESGADHDHQLPVTDLMVSISDDRVVLRSRQLGKEVRPQLATAHNYTRGSLVIYRFLCSLAGQGTSGYSWSWGVLDDAPFLPRLRRGKLVLSRARWLLRRPELELLAQAAKGAAAAKTPAQIAAVRAREILAARTLRERRGLPRWVVVADGDNELPVDFDNALSVESFVALVKGRPFVGLYELMPAPDQLAVHGPEGAHTHELMVTFVRETPPPSHPPVVPPVAPPIVPPVVPPVALTRRFPPGSAWLYAKVYAGTASCDSLLREIAPFLRGVTAERLVERFFFIRYSDPDNHVRLRFLGEPRRLAGELLPRLAAAIEPALARGLVWRMQLDTYEREVERYGGDRAIELVEELFAADSEAVLAIVETTSGDEGAVARWHLTVRGLDQLLADLGMTLAQRLELVTRLRDNFGAEHGMDTAFQRRLGEKFRTHRNELATLLTMPASDTEHDLAPGLAAFACRSERIAPLAGALRRVPLTTTFAALAGSLMHMHANRMLASMHRRQELVLYDLLRRHYDGVLARERGAIKKPG